MKFRSTFFTKTMNQIIKYFKSFKEVQPLKNKNDTQLSSKLWKVKDSEETPVITGTILGQ